nr:hypothetical protein B0A51_09023 [Rachicladosporium sp. CCFEE 5018]
MDHDSAVATERDADMMDTSNGDEGIAVKQENHTMITPANDDIDTDTEMKLEEDLPTSLLDHTHDHTSPSPFSFTRSRLNIPYNPADEPVEIFKINKAPLTHKAQTAYLEAINKPAPPPVITVAAIEDLNGGNGENGHTTPPLTPPHSNPLKFASNCPLPPAPWTGPNPDTDVLAHVRKHQKLHTRVLVLRPKERLRPGRYWIAVLPPSSISPHAQAAKLSPMWFKGNRLTTIETVWKTYSQKAMLEDFGLWLGGELLWDGKEVGKGVGGRLKDGGWGAKGVWMQECDLFGDKVVVLRAVEFGREGGLGLGRKITEGLVSVEREVVVIELD